MKYKLLMIDIDDTLLTRDKRILPGVEQALRHAQQRGVTLSIASGRLPYGVRPYAQALGALSHGGYIVSFNGGKVFDASGRVISSATLDPKFLPEVYAMTLDYPVTVLVHKDDMIVADRRENRYTMIEPEAVGLPLNQADDLVRYVDWPLHKILIAGDPEVLLSLQKELLGRFAGELDIYLSAPFFLDIMPKGVNKGEALRLIADDIGVTPDEAIACGDSYNDLSMIEAAGLGVAMANAEPALKEKADYITALDCDHEGLREVVEKFL